MDKKKRSLYEKPDLKFIRVTEADIITASGGDDKDDGEDREGELIPMPTPGNVII